MGYRAIVTDAQFRNCYPVLLGVVRKNVFASLHIIPKKMLECSFGLFGGFSHLRVSLKPLTVSILQDTDTGMTFLGRVALHNFVIACDGVEPSFRFRNAVCVGTRIRIKSVSVGFATLANFAERIFRKMRENVVDCLSASLLLVSQPSSFGFCV